MVKHVDSGGQVHLVTNIRKPRKWRRYEYLESSGTLYIDTGIKGYMNHTYELDFLMNDTDNYRTWGVLAQSNYIGYNMSFTYLDPANWIVRWESVSGNDHFITLGTKDTNRHLLKISNGAIYFDNISKGTSGGHNTNVVINYNLFLFTINPADTTPSSNAKVKIYAYKDIDVLGNLVRHMVPAQYNGKYGMWDLVEDKFYPNKGTGSFTVGPEMKNYDEIHEVRRTSSLLPAGVELYDYILSNGTQWINTGYIPKGNFGTEIKFQLTATSSFATIWGSMPSSSLTTPRTGFHNYPLSLWMAGINATSSFGTANTNVHTLKLTFSNGTETMILDGNQVYIYSPRATALSSNNLSIGLFARNLNPVTNYTAMKCYYFSINDGSTLVRNFIPCTYLGEPGMWDTVENKFYRNQGTGLFTLGNKITLKEYEYLLGDGSSYIDTKTYGNLNTKVDLKITTTEDNNYSIFGDYVTANLSTFCIGRDSGMAKIFALFDSVSPNIINTLSSAANTTYIINLSKDGFINDNTKYREFPNATTFTTANTLKIFEAFYSLKNKGKFKLHYCKLYENNQLVRNFIPISYNGTPGLWDKVEWKFYGNAGTGSFTLGPEKASGVYPVRRTLIDELLFTFRQTANGEKLMRNTAQLNGIKGNSVVWNQLMMNPSFTNGDYWLLSDPSKLTKSVWNNVITVTCTLTISSDDYKLYQRINDSSLPAYYDKIWIQNHKYILIAYVKSNMSTRLGVGGANYDQISLKSTTGTNTMYEETYFYVKFKNHTQTPGAYPNISCLMNEGDSFSIENFVMYDVTLIYGPDNEPITVEKFKEDYFKWFGKSLSYELYDAGSIRSVKSTELKSVGFNQLSISDWYDANPLVARGTKSLSGNTIYLTATGSDAYIGNVLTTNGKNYTPGCGLLIPVLPNTAYYWKLDGTLNSVYVGCFNYAKKTIGYLGSGVNKIFTTPTECRYINFRVGKINSVDGTTYYGIPYLNISDTTKNGETKSYISSFIPIPITSITGKLNGTGNSVVVFPEGMKSVDSVHDEILVENGVTKAIKRVGSVDLGTLTWIRYIPSKRTNYHFRSNTSKNDLNSSFPYIGICAKYAMSGLQYGEADKTINYVPYTVTNQINIVDNSYTDATTFKTAMSGVYLYYELNTPEEYILDSFTLPQSIQVERGGTEEVISSDSTSVGPTLQLQYTV